MNLPNSITVGRIALMPAVAVLPFVDGWVPRLLAWILFLVAAITDYVDGNLARSRGQITDLGKLLDPLADKLLLFGTLVPMYLLQGPEVGDAALGRILPFLRDVPGASAFPLLLTADDTPTRVFLPLWIVLVVLGRELFMTVFRQAAARRGLVIAAIGPAKWKTGFQSTWVGAAYFWFFWATLVERFALAGNRWADAMTVFTGWVAVASMVGAVFLTVWSLLLYLRRYGAVVFGFARPHRP